MQLDAHQPTTHRNQATTTTTPHTPPPRAGNFASPHQARCPATPTNRSATHTSSGTTLGPRFPPPQCDLHEQKRQNENEEPPPPPPCKAQANTFPAGHGKPPGGHQRLIAAGAAKLTRRQAGRRQAKALTTSATRPPAHTGRPRRRQSHASVCTLSAWQKEHHTDKVQLME